MGTRIRMAGACSALAFGLGALAGASAQGNVSDGNGDTGDFDKASVVVEINATDGDIGFQTLFDVDAWNDTRIYAPTGQRIFDGQASDSLAEQGLTENSFESAEPLCAPDPDQPDARVVTLSDFIDRFPAGSYSFIATMIDGEKLQDRADLTYSLPAAPDILGFDGTTVTWQAGTDLGKCQDDNLVSSGKIPDPGGVEPVGWEITVEPADDEPVEPLRVYSVQLPAGAPTMVTVPSQFVDSYLADGISAFKVEIGAIEASGNRTFSQEDFDLGQAQGTGQTQGGDQLQPGDQSQSRDETQSRDESQTQDENQARDETQSRDDTQTMDESQTRDENQARDETQSMDESQSR